jgi:hypothetical protein
MERTSRRLFMRRAGLAAGGLAVPGWALWFGEQMEKLQPTKHVVVARPTLPMDLGPWAYNVRMSDGAAYALADYVEMAIAG